MSNFQIDEDFKIVIESLIAKKSNLKLKNKLKDLHYADIAELSNKLNSDQATYLIKLLESEKTADVLPELDEDLREAVLQNLSPKEIAEEVEILDTDDAADIIAELPENRKEKVMLEITDSSHIDDIRELLTYDENSAGGLMAKELVSVEENLSVLKCLNTIKSQAEEITRIHSVYVVNNKNILIGRLSLKDLLTSNSRDKVKDIYIPKVDFVNVNQSGEEVAKIMSKYDLEAIPVVNEEKELVGRITIDDIVDLIKEEAEKDYQLAAGIASDVEADDTILDLTKAR